MIADQDRDDFRRGYAVAMAWANTYIDREPYECLDAIATLESDGLWHIAADSVPGADVVLDMTDANAFMDRASTMLAYVTEKFGTDWGQHGHDFALTRNHHGAGFWDRGYSQHGDKLTKIAATYGEAEVWL